jgi:LacI family transcriptional regulator
VAQVLERRRNHLRAIRATRLPAVDLRGVVRSHMPVVKADDRRVMELAVEHLLERGFAHLAYCGFTDLPYSERRLKHLVSVLHERDIRCNFYQAPPPRPNAPQREIERIGVLFNKELAAWLRSLPKPIGIIACNDIRGQQVLNTCREMDLAVPEDVAVIGVDNDEVLCEMSDPPMSSVELDTHKAGYEAAALLHRLVRGGAVPMEPVLIAPKAVICRQSTDTLAIADRHVAAAVRFIRLHASDGLKIKDVLDHVPLSRRLLERRFRKLLGHSPHAEIARVRIERIKQLLLGTDWPLESIARATGFAGADYMSVAFKKETHLSPGAFRSKLSAARRTSPTASQIEIPHTGRRLTPQTSRDRPGRRQRTA